MRVGLRMGVMVACRVFFKILVSAVVAMWHYAPKAGVPFPAALLDCFFAIEGFELAAKGGAALVLFVPVFGSVFFPVLAELRGE